MFMHVKFFVRSLVFVCVDYVEQTRKLSYRSPIIGLPNISYRSYLHNTL